ncbi:MAG: phosphotransferase [Burkholderiales bacterium]|nr:phosphotransferase [Burkholderiales bacterium]
MSESPADTRLAALADWLAAVLAPDAFSLAPASSDASFRRYFRVFLAAPHALAPDESTLIAMDAPPPQEDCRPFVHVASLLTAAGVNAPRVLAQDIARGFLLLTDLGSTPYLDVLDASSANRLYGDALDALVRFQVSSREGVLPPYDRALLQRELDLFPVWYVARHRAHALDAAQLAALDRVFCLLLDNNLAQPRVYVHRDYHSRNLMVSAPNPGVLDFQDAVHGPVTYDLVSLLRDAYIEWDEELQIDWAVRYWKMAHAAGIPVTADFGDLWRDFEWMGVQRQLKVLGIFARLYHRDGKAGYLDDIPRVMRYLRGACARYRELGPLLAVLDAVDAQVQVPATGHGG